MAHLYLYWDDGATDDQEFIAFELEITPLDLAGNEGPPTTVTVLDAGSGGGCGLTHRPGSAAALLLALTLALLAAARRRCELTPPRPRC
jgi:hypothetical protein